MNELFYWQDELEQNKILLQECLEEGDKAGEATQRKVISLIERKIEELTLPEEEEGMDYTQLCLIQGLSRYC
ncbi:MAG: hypothetical protein LUH22_03140 [Bacteroides sp.]|nr:hypothetical protein [Bacteroides sp.]